MVQICNKIAHHCHFGNIHRKQHLVVVRKYSERHLVVTIEANHHICGKHAT